MTTRSARRISVAMCTYNGARFVEDQLASIYRQTLLPDEIVVADDGSSDGTLDVVRDVAARFDPDRRVDLMILGPTATRLLPAANFVRAMRACRGEVIALADQDDRWREDKLATTVERLTSDDCELVVTNGVVTDESLAPTGQTIFDLVRLRPADRDATFRDPLTRLIKDNFAPGMTFVLKRSLLDAATPFPESWLHDYWLALVAAARSSLSVVDEPLVEYRQHATNHLSTAQASIATAPPWFDHPRMWRGSIEEVESLATHNPAAARALLAKLRFECDRYQARRNRAPIRIATAALRGDYARFTLLPGPALRIDLAAVAGRWRYPDQ